jgi:hypothetical protein
MMNQNWIEKEDGWHKVEESKMKGNAHYFSRPIPPVRDTSGRPLKDGKIDTARWIKEVNEKSNQ